MAACGGCGATMSPAEAYCAGCGAAARRGPLLDLERVDRTDAIGVTPRRSGDAPPARHGESRRGGTVVSSNRSWPTSPWRWPLFLAVVGVVGAVMATVTVIGGDDRAQQPTPTVPERSATASPSTTSIAGSASGANAGSPPAATAAATEQAFPPLGEVLPYEVVAVDITGTAHLLDLTTGAVEQRDLTVGPLADEPVTDVVGGPVGPLVLRSSLLQYFLVDLDDPARSPVALDEGTLAAHDDETGWSWFGGCRTPPCQRTTQVTGFGPGVSEGRTVELPPPTARVVATDGRLFVEAAGSIVMIDPSNGVQRIVATGSLLDARGHVVAVRSCNPDLTCPVSVIDIGVESTTFHIDGDDIRLAPGGDSVVGGTPVPALVPTLVLFDVPERRAVTIDPAELLFVSVPFRFSPDGEWLIGATGARNLVAVRMRDGAVFRVPFPGLDRTIAGLLVRPR